MTKPLPEIQPCLPCDSVKHVKLAGDRHYREHYVYCSRCGERGPDRRTVRGAINAWKIVQEAMCVCNDCQVEIDDNGRVVVRRLKRRHTS